MDWLNTEFEPSQNPNTGSFFNPSLYSALERNGPNNTHSIFNYYTDVIVQFRHMKNIANQ